MAPKRSPERVLGPYDHVVDGRTWYRIVRVFADRRPRKASLFATEREAERYKELLLAELGVSDHTTETALAEYMKHLETKGTQAQSRDVTRWAIEQFFPGPITLSMLSAKRCEALYVDLYTRPTAISLKRAAKDPVTYKPQPLAADTHRNALAQTKSFLEWCVKKGWIAENPCAEVDGVGKRRPRGKSLGKRGNELRVKQAREWYRTALELALQDDEGAIAALIALLLGLRASEIVSRKVGDLDEDAAAGDLLWIPCAKTPAGRRTLEVPEVLRALLVDCIEGKESDRYVFECERPHEVGRGLPHDRGWVIAQVHRICDAAKVPQVTAHAMRGLLSTIAGDRGTAGHVIAATLGHEDERTTKHAYAAPGSFEAGDRRRGFKIIDGGVK